jgi:hypothetical protein
MGCEKGGTLVEISSMAFWRAWLFNRCHTTINQYSEAFTFVETQLHLYLSLPAGGLCRKYSLNVLGSDLTSLSRRDILGYKTLSPMHWRKVQTRGPRQHRHQSASRSPTLAFKHA